MVGLGTLGDKPPNAIQPPLLDGIHMRWAFEPILGFPWFGFYLFRRLHQKGSLDCLSRVVGNLQPGPLSDNKLATAYGKIDSDKNLYLTDSFPSAQPGGVNSVEFDLENREYVRFTFAEPVRRSEISIGFRNDAEIQITGMLWDVPVKQLTINGNAQQVLSASIEFDTISAIQISPGPAALVDLCFVPVSQESNTGWQQVPQFKYPLCFPITHPDYPCTKGIVENLSNARNVGRDRIRYDNPDHFVVPEVPLIYSDGTVSVTNGSPIVIGNGTNWSQNLTGKFFQVNGDNSGYTILMSISQDKLVLSRNYVSTSVNGTAYTINEDAFGKLYDNLIHLVTGGSSDGSMISRSIPSPVYSDGTVSVTNGSPIVIGNGTNWDATLNGLIFETKIPINSDGTVSVTNGSPIVIGNGTNWDAGFEGSTFQIAGESTEYIISNVDSPTQLRLDQNYNGLTNDGKSFTIRESTEYIISNVDSPTQLRLDQNYNGSTDSQKRYSITIRMQSIAQDNIVTTVSNQRPLDFVLLGSSHPSVAQMIGLYWVDQQADNAVAYDYLLIGDYNGISNGDSNSILEQLKDKVFCYSFEKINPSEQLHSPWRHPDNPKLVISWLAPSTEIVRPQGRVVIDDLNNRLHNAVCFPNSVSSGTGGTSPNTITIDLPEPAKSVSVVAIDNEGYTAIGVNKDGYSLPTIKMEPRDTRAFITGKDIVRVILHGSSTLCIYGVCMTIPPDFSTMDGYIIFNKVKTAASPLAAPTNVRAYSLPGNGTIVDKDNTIKDVSNNAGLRWDLATTNLGIIQPDHSFMYYLWRYDAGDNEPTSTPPASNYKAIMDEDSFLFEPSILSDSFNAPERRADWPSFGMYAIDRALPDGWYSYQVSGVDIFGRHSPNSQAAQWYEWAPPPSPKPWYYQDPPGDKSIHPFAIRLLDKTPPPSPTAIEAFALDLADPTIFDDTVYNEWKSSLIQSTWYQNLSEEQKQNLIGLRVRWLWTKHEMEQAPDTREFRIYFHPGEMNALLGMITKTFDANKTELDILTDIPNTFGVNAYSGTSLAVDANSRSFKILTSEASNPLRLKIKNKIIYNDGTISVTNRSPIITGRGTKWTSELVGSSLQIANEKTTYTILSIDSTKQTLTLNRNYWGRTGQGKSYTITGKTPMPQANSSCTITIPDYPQRHPLFTDYSMPESWEQRYYVVDYNEHVTIDEAESVRKYEILLPVTSGTSSNNHGGIPLIVSLLKPKSYAYIGVSAADNKTHTQDNPKWISTGSHWTGRYGNEGRIGAPAKIFRMLRTIPEPPVPVPPPADAERVYATRADNFQGYSYYTYRWRAIDGLNAHIFRALDDTLFKVDWSERPRRSQPSIDPDNMKLFPPEPRFLDRPRREQIARDLNQLNSFTRDSEGTKQALAYYRKLLNDALRVLAGLPGNENAFVQLTFAPLRPDDPANDDRVGPDNDPSFHVDASLRAYIDTLDGRSTNRYFYRAVYEDAVHNRSALGLSGPPVWLPDVVAPHVPVVTKVLGGDRKIVVKWASNREPDLMEYRLYRSDNASAARNTILMSLVHIETVPAGDPARRPSEFEWTDNDTTLQPGRLYYYRIVAVSSSKIASPASEKIASSIFDDSRPEPPIWNPPRRLDLSTEVVLSWSSPDPNLKCLVQRKISGSEDWEEDFGRWLPRGTYQYIDKTRVSGLTYDYRVKVLDTRGRSNRDFLSLSI